MLNFLIIEIDYCQKCRGFWFGKKELDKTLERSAVAIEGECGFRQRVLVGRTKLLTYHFFYYKPSKQKNENFV